jgi:hypothetical protein
MIAISNDCTDIMERIIEIYEKICKNRKIKKSTLIKGALNLYFLL